MDDFQERLVDLQTRIAYQEDTLSQLDDVTINQAERIDRLEASLRQLYQRLDGALPNNDQSAVHEPPPHY